MATHHLIEVDTPAAVVDIDALDRNIAAAVAAVLRSTASGCRVSIRPHAKAHKSPFICRRQIDQSRGLTTGVCCQKLSEAEAMFAGGVRDILLSNQIVGASKLSRLAALAASGAQLGLLVDDAENCRAISDAVASAHEGVTISLLIEVDVGQHRCGVDTVEEAVALGTLISSLPGVRLGGIQAYQGMAQHMRTPQERRATIDGVVAKARVVRDALLAAGLTCDTVTGGGTGTFTLEAASGVFTEVQPGSYALMDVDYSRNIGDDGREVWAAGPFEPALFLLSPVMSVRAPIGPSAGWCVIDSGLKAQSTDSGNPVVATTVEEYVARVEKGGLHARGVEWDARAGAFSSSVAHLRVASVSDEHSTLVPASGGRATALLPQRGTKLLLVPGHCDPFVNHFDEVR